jgi:hypothetical protein
VLTSGQRRFLALPAAIGAVAGQVMASFPSDPTNAQVAWLGLALVLTALPGLLLVSQLQKKL